MAPRLDLSEEAIQWLNQSEQQRDDSDSRRRKRDVLYDVDTLAFRRFRRQAPSDQRVEVGDVLDEETGVTVEIFLKEDHELDQETGVEIYVQIFLDHGDEARNETLEVIVNLSKSGIPLQHSLRLH